MKIKLDFFNKTTGKSEALISKNHKLDRMRGLRIAELRINVEDIRSQKDLIRLVSGLEEDVFPCLVK